MTDRTDNTPTVPTSFEKGAGRGALNRLKEVTERFNKPRVTQSEKQELIKEAGKLRRTAARGGFSPNEIAQAEGGPPIQIGTI